MWLCPQCGSALPEVTASDSGARCSVCREFIVRPLAEGEVVPPPIVGSGEGPPAGLGLSITKPGEGPPAGLGLSITKPGEAPPVGLGLSIIKPGEAAGPWSNELPGDPEGPWSDRLPEGAIALPFDPQAEWAPSTAESRRGTRLLRALAATVVFLLALIGTAELARYFRPWLTGRPLLSRAALERAIGAIQTGTPQQRQEAAGQIAAMGPAAIVATLERITIEDPANDKFYMIQEAVRALAGTGGPAVGGLCEALHRPPPAVRAGAASVLAEMGAAGREALEPLLAALKDENHWVRWLAADALGNMGSDGAPATTALLKLLDDPTAATRRHAVEALGRIGPAARAALPALKSAETDDADASVRHAATVALRQMNLDQEVEQSLGEASDQVRELIQSLAGDDEESSTAAAKTLGELNLQAKEAIPALVLTLRNNSPRRREAAARALGHMGLLAETFLPTIQAAAKDADPDVRAAAEKALKQISGQP